MFFSVHGRKRTINSLSRVWLLASQFFARPRIVALRVSLAWVSCFRVPWAYLLVNEKEIAKFGWSFTRVSTSHLWRSSATFHVEGAFSHFRHIVHPKSAPIFITPSCSAKCRDFCRPFMWSRSGIESFMWSRRSGKSVPRQLNSFYTVLPDFGLWS